MSTTTVQKVALVISSLLVFQLVCQARGNAIKDLYIKDETGKNVCVDLDCFVFANTTATLDFNLVIDTPVSGLLFSIIIDGGGADPRQLTNGFTVHACYCEKSRKVLLTATCNANTIPVGTYNLNYGVYVLDYFVGKVAVIEVESNKGFFAVRGLVQW